MYHSKVQKSTCDEIYKQLATESFSLSITEIRLFVSLDIWGLDVWSGNEQMSWDSLTITSKCDIKVTFFFSPEK